MFWWALASLTLLASVFVNITLRDGYSWIPTGIGILSFVVLWTDIVVRNRIDRAQLAATAERTPTDEASAAVGTVAVAAAPGYIAALTVAITLTLGSSVLGTLMIAGLNNAYSFPVVVQEARPATTQLVHGSAMNLTQTDGRICGGGEDYSDCLNMHIAMYNSVCVGMPLTASARSTCADLSTFIDDVSARAADCGSGCTTRTDEQGLWGWAYLRPTSERVAISNDNRLPEITHDEHCVFSLGAVQFGNCPGLPPS